MSKLDAATLVLEALGAAGVFGWLYATSSPPLKSSIAVLAAHPAVLVLGLICLVLALTIIASRIYFDESVAEFKPSDQCGAEDTR